VCLSKTTGYLSLSLEPCSRKTDITLPWDHHLWLSNTIAGLQTLWLIASMIQSQGTARKRDPGFSVALLHKKISSSTRQLLIVHMSQVCLIKGINKTPLFMNKLSLQPANYPWVAQLPLPFCKLVQALTTHPLMALSIHGLDRCMTLQKKRHAHNDWHRTEKGIWKQDSERKKTSCYK
jgi:hypothetical protein